MTESSTPELEAYLASCPLFGIYADTGVGKTYLAASLIQHPRYRPLRLIDVDLGVETVASLAAHPELVEYRKYNGSEEAMDMVRWLVREIEEAYTADCGSIVIEGIAKIYMMIKDELATQMWKGSPNMTAADFEKRLTGNSGRRLYQTGSALVGSVITQVDKLRKARRRAVEKGAPGVPIVVTLTTRSSLQGDAKINNPGLSENKTKDLVSSCDVFMELTRDVGANTKLRTERDPLHPFVKVRNPVAAKAIGKLVRPTMPQVIDAILEGRAATDDATAAMLSSGK